MTRKEFFIIAIATFITLVLWVVFDILHTRAKEEISPQLQQEIQPISPEFDLSPLDN